MLATKEVWDPRRILQDGVAPNHGHHEVQNLVQVAGGFLHVTIVQFFRLLLLTPVVHPWLKNGLDGLLLNGIVHNRKESNLEILQGGVAVPVWLVLESPLV